MRKKIFALSKLSLLLLTADASFAATANPLPPYPPYINASGVSAKDQVRMEALWLHLSATRIDDVTIPKSFAATAYWNYLAANNPDYQQYRQSHDNGTCNIAANDSNDATIERAMQQQGLDIYDGAVWQIALSLAAKLNPTAYIADVQSYKNFLLNGIPSGFLSYYAYKAYSYNGKNAASEKNAYLLKFISPSWASNYDALNQCNMQWPEWSAVTGEEAWAALIGPIQSIYILNDGRNNSNWSSDPQASDYIQLGKNALSVIENMQAPSGGVYRNVTAPSQNQNFDISLENNFSLYAGLSMLRTALKDRDAIYQSLIKQEKIKTPNSNTKLQAQLRDDQSDIQIIDKIKQGLVQFFAGNGGVTVFDKDSRYFYAAVNGNQADTQHFAVDVQTWGATVIASDKKDPSDPNDPNLLQAMTDAYGKDVMFDMLQAAINHSGYKDAQNNLLGVGYTTQTPKDSFYELSGEWTLGAINAAMVLAKYYGNDHDKTSQLMAQTKSMLQGVTQETSNLEGTPASQTAQLSYLYANKRAFIPFGWFSNKAPATASTGWSLMVNSCFNPLELGGGQYQNICQQVLK